MDKEEFMRRLRARFVEKAGEGADAVVDNATYEEWSHNYPDDPEATADEEMEYWTDDDGVLA